MKKLSSAEVLFYLQVLRAHSSIFQPEIREALDRATKAMEEAAAKDMTTS